MNTYTPDWKKEQEIEHWKKENYEMVCSQCGIRAENGDQQDKCMACGSEYFVYRRIVKE